MSKIITAVMLALAFAALVGSAHAEFKWKHPGADPYATSRDGAMKTRESAFLKLGFPTEVVARFMEATKKPGEKVRLVMGDRLTTMLSKGGVVHKDVVIAWESPIRGTELVAPAEKWQVTWEGKTYTAILFEVCYNWSSIVGPVPKSVAPPVKQYTLPPKSPTLTQYALQINCMSDREDGFWRSKYDTAKAKRAENLKRADINEKGMLPYYEVFTLAPFGEMLAERKSRPQDCRFLVRFLKKEPVLNIQSGDSATERAQKYSEYLKQFQYPLEDNVLTGGWVSTGSRGWVIVPVFAFDDFEAVLIQPEQIGDVLEPVIVVHRPEFEKLSNPVHIWEVKQ